MDLIIKWEEKELIFNGEKVTFEIFPLSHGGVLKILPYIDKFRNLEEIKPEELFSVVKEAKDIFPEHVRNIDGVTINGEPVTPEMAASQGKLLNLSLGILTMLINISIPQKIELKN